MQRKSHPTLLFLALKLTLDSRYAATERSVPAIAIAASNQKIAYFDIKNQTNEATWAAKISVKVIDQLINSSPKGGPLLPVGYGMTVNIPPLSANNSDPPIVQTRMTGNAHINEAVWDAKKGVFTWANIKPYAAGVNACNSGDCSLPGETYVVENGRVSVSLYITDYSAPSTEYTASVMKRIEPLTKKS